MGGLIPYNTSTFLTHKRKALPLKHLLKNLLGARRFANYPQASLPGYWVAAALLAAAFAGYLIGGVGAEVLLRLTVLVAAGAAALIVIAHRVHPLLGRWTALLGAAAYIFWLARLWSQPDLLFLLLVLVVLAALLLNLPAVGLAALALALLVPLGGNLPPSRLPVFEAVLWLTALAVGGATLLAERMLAQASEDYDHLQSALAETRAQQFKLAQALDDLAFANRQLALLYDKNVSLRKIAEEATAARTVYIARVSHEIRTPLNMILGITESIIEDEAEYRDEVPADLLDDIHIIRRNSEHLLSLVNDVLDLTRAETSQLVLKREWVDIGAEIEAAVEIVQPLARKKHLTLETGGIGGGGPRGEMFGRGGLPLVYCDRTRIRQVILNLLSNAVRYTEQGSVRVEAAAADEWLTVTVRDTGPGILEDDVERVFEPFYRGQSSGVQEAVGTGLGLSVSRQFVELHNGKIWLESRPGAGSCFAFRLPLLAGKPGEAAGSSPRRPAARFVGEQWMWMEPRRRGPFNFQQATRKRILVLDPEDTLWSRLDLEAEEAGFERVAALDGLAESLRSAPAHLVLVNGHDAESLRQILPQAEALAAGTPVVGCAFASPRDKLADLGAVDYLQKPFSLSRLREIAARHAPQARKIMIVEDNVEAQRLVARALQLEADGLEFILAESGEQALDLLRRPARRPHLVLLDLALPGLSGWEVLEAIQRDESLRGIPVVILSAHDLSDDPLRSPVLALTRAGGLSVEEVIRLAMETTA